MCCSLFYTQDVSSLCLEVYVINLLLWVSNDASISSIVCYTDRQSVNWSTSATLRWYVTSGWMYFTVRCPPWRVMHLYKITLTFDDFNDSFSPLATLPNGVIHSYSVGKLPLSRHIWMHIVHPWWVKWSDNCNMSWFFFPTWYTLWNAVINSYSECKLPFNRCI